MTRTALKVAIAALLAATASAFAGNTAYGCSPIVVVKPAKQHHIVKWQAQPVVKKNYHAPTKKTWNSTCSTVKVVKPTHYAASSSCTTVKIVKKTNWQPVKKPAYKTSSRGRFNR